MDTSADPHLGAERGEALLLMEKLTPSERAAYVLREAFDYPYGQIADILQSIEPTVEAVNGRPGLALRRGGRAVAVRVSGARAAELWLVLNPVKLRHWL